MSTDLNCDLLRLAMSTDVYCDLLRLAFSATKSISKKHFNYLGTERSIGIKILNI